MTTCELCMEPVDGVDICAKCGAKIREAQERARFREKFAEEVALFQKFYTAILAGGGAGNMTFDSIARGARSALEVYQAAVAHREKTGAWPE